VANLAGITAYSVALYILTARKLRGAGLWVSILGYGALGVVYFAQVALPVLAR
jgi:hypothetical protein